MPVRTRGLHVFDRDVIKKRWSKINESPIKKAGLLVRKIARGSIRVRKGPKPSPVGAPPRSRASGKPFKLIFSVPNSLATQAVVGPTGFNKDTIPTPAVHEFGERAIRTVFVKEDSQRRSTKGRFRKKRRLATRKAVQYPKRPFMRPALEEARPDLPDFWKDSLK